MKNQIDKFVREILYHLDQASVTRLPELDAVLQTVGMDSLSQAVTRRATIERWADDMTLADDMREYAQQQLAGLPTF